MIALALLAALPAYVFAQQSYRVKNINPTLAALTSYPRDGLVWGEYIYFTAAATNPYIRELWRSDGTAEGTMRVKSCDNADDPRNPTYLTLVGDTLYFVANSFNHGIELWKSDGTGEGTQLIRDIYPGSVSSNPGNFVVSDGILYFIATSPDHGRELWRSDGTWDGTHVVRDIYPGPGSPLIRGFAANSKINGKFFFWAADELHGQEPWVTDGTPGGTTMLKDLLPGQKYRSEFDTSTLLMNGLLYFEALDAGGQPQIWATDGTEDGTFIAIRFPEPVHDARLKSARVFKDNLVIEVATLKPSNVFLMKYDGLTTSILANFAGGVMLEYNGHLYLKRSELWKSDGTPEGTQKVDSGIPSWNIDKPIEHCIFQGKLYIVARAPLYEHALWRIDEQGQAKVVTGPARCPVGIGESLYYQVGQAIHACDGSSAGSVIFKSVDDSLHDFYGHAFAYANQGGYGTEPWISDGTPGGTRLVKDITWRPNPSFPCHLTPLNGLTYFFAASAALPRFHLWVTDGTHAGTRIVETGPGSEEPPLAVAELNGRIYIFRLSPFPVRLQLWFSDGQPGPLQLLKDFDREDGDKIRNLVKAGNRLFFVVLDNSHGRIACTDGTSEGTYIVEDANYHPYKSNNPLVPLGKDIYFAGRQPDLSETLSRTDGTPGGTAVLNANTITGITGANNRLYYKTRPSIYSNREYLWTRKAGASTDTSNDTLINSKLLSPPFYPGANILAVDDDDLYFATSDLVSWPSGYALTYYLTGGTTETTRQLPELGVGSVAINGEFFFRQRDDLLQRDTLFKFNSKTNQVTRLTDVAITGNFFPASGCVFFEAVGAEGTFELWRSDGSVNGTKSVSDHSGGIPLSWTENIRNTGTHLYFAGESGDGDVELWAVRLAGGPEIWAQFDYVGMETGSEQQPFNSLDEALAAVDAAGRIHINPGQSGEILRISQPVRLEAAGGAVRIGVAGIPAALQMGIGRANPASKNSASYWLMYE